MSTFKILVTHTAIPLEGGQPSTRHFCSIDIPETLRETAGTKFNELARLFPANEGFTLGMTRWETFGIPEKVRNADT